MFKQSAERVGTGRLNAAIREILTQHRPSTPSGRKARIYYATQIEVQPPTIVLFVNNPAYFDDSYQRFMINRFRESLPFKQVPIRLMIRARQRGMKSDAPVDETDPDAALVVAKMRTSEAGKARPGSRPARKRKR